MNNIINEIENKYKQIKIIKIETYEDYDDARCEMFYNNIKAYGMYNKKIKNFYVITVCKERPTYIKMCDDNNNFYVLKNKKKCYRHVSLNGEDFLLEVKLKKGTIVSILHDCIKVSELIPKRLFDYKNGKFIEIEYEYVTSHNGKLNYFKNETAYPDKYIDPYQFTSGLYVCNSIRDLLSWGCNKFNKIKLDEFLKLEIVEL